MKNAVSKLMEKRGLKPEELTPEEKATLEQWRTVLSKGSIKAPDIAAFCEMQKGVIERQFKDLDRSEKKTERLVLLHSVYSAILGLIRNPQSEKEALERYLTSML